MGKLENNKRYKVRAADSIGRPMRGCALRMRKAWEGLVRVERGLHVWMWVGVDQGYEETSADDGMRASKTKTQGKARASREMTVGLSGCGCM